MAKPKYTPFVTDFPKPQRPAPVPTTASVKAQWGVPAAGYAPGFFGGPKVPKRGTVPNRAGLIGGIYQDPGVIGQTVGDYTPIPTTYGQGDQEFTLDTSGEWGGQPPLNRREQARANILNDPEYLQGLQNLRDALASGQSRTRNALRQAVIGAGFDPRQGAQALGYDPTAWSQYLEEPDYAAAAQNPYSARAQLEGQRQTAVGNMVARLAARNMLRSGASAAGGSIINQGYQSATNQQLGGLLQALQSGQQDYADYARQQQQDWLTRQGAIAQRLGLSDWSPV